MRVTSAIFQVMPPLSRWFIRAGFAALMLALLLELFQLRPGNWLPGLPEAALHLAAIHLMTVGWLLQLITGVAFWMFPRHPTDPPRGRPNLGWWAFGLLNGGLVLRLAGESWRQGYGGPTWPLVVAAASQLVAVCCITVLLWPRIRETGTGS